jgi:Zn-dependent peptidase ImmA (M78 family)
MRAHSELDIDTLRPIDPFLALHRSGVLVMRQSLDRLSGAYLPGDSVDGGRAGVLINVAHPLSRQRYTAAHELWHHRRDREIVFDEDTEWLARGENGESDRERLAEAFASWFLMPRRLVESTLARLGESAQALDERVAYTLSLELGTSYRATVRQLYGLNQIDATRRDRLLGVTPQSIKRTLGEIDVAADSWRDIRLVRGAVAAASVVALEGDVIVLELPEIPSSGYLWQPVGVPDIVSLVRDEYRPAAPGTLGGSGIHRFVFSVQSRGHRRIRFELGRPWLQGKFVDARDLDVVAEPKPAPGIVDPFVLVGEAA